MAYLLIYYSVGEGVPCGIEIENFNSLHDEEDKSNVTKRFNELAKKANVEDIQVLHIDHTEERITKIGKKVVSINILDFNSESVKL